MIRTHRTAVAIILLLAGLSACSKASEQAAPASNAVEQPAPVTSAPASLPPAQLPDLPAQPPGDDPATFVPLGSQAVKDAIHRALRSATTQRWHDGKLSGYAVPSVSTDAHGCRAVRYTVDQRPGAAYETINACDASR